MTAVFTMNDEQKRLALETKAEQEKKHGQTIHTQILPITKFWWAEDYHQKYYLRQDRDLMREFGRIYPDWKEFTNSTAVARANAAVGHNLSRTELDKLRDQLGLSPSAIKRLEGYAR
jgi:peptide-methionine (S)-S-oxide reductase